MITKALISALPEPGSNMFKVRIPYLEDNTRVEYIREATYCIMPGIYEGLSVGDCVYVGFEDDLLNKPVILGKLYISSDDPAPTKIVTDNCIVKSHIDLPDNTTINGYGAKQFLSFEQLTPQ